MKYHGFTLVEVAVALILLGVGMSAALRASGALVALTARSARALRVAAVAEHHLELGPIGGCGARSGRTVDGVLDVVWRVSATGGVGDVVVRVHWPDRRGMRVDTFVTAFPCP